MRTEAQKNARNRYEKNLRKEKKCKNFQVMVYPTETEIMRKLTEVDSYRAYIKGLILDDIKRNG